MIRHQLAVVLLIGISLISALALLLDVSKVYSAAPERTQIAQFQARFAEVRKSLPAHGVIGYITDSSPNPTTRTTEYYLAQYSLAPLVLVDDSNQPLVVANFHTAAPDAALLNASRLEVVRSFGNGVFLLRGRR